MPVSGVPADHPDYLNGDLNLALRGWASNNESLALVDYTGGTDPNAPKFTGVFADNRAPTITSAYVVNNWDWNPANCGGAPDGCRGTPISTWPVTMVGFETTPGEVVRIPSRSPDIYPTGNYKTMVLYAMPNRITFVYTREDTVAVGYAVHMEGLCVYPALISLYQAQVDGSGWHDTGNLPTLKNGQALGVACRSELLITIRDSGSFMDPRSRKDWW